MANDLVERLERVAAERSKAEPFADKTNYMQVYAKLSRADGALLTEAAAALKAAEALPEGLSLTCPIGLDADRDICSAGTCIHCFVLHVKHDLIAARARADANADHARLANANLKNAHDALVAARARIAELQAQRDAWFRAARDAMNTGTIMPVSSLLSEQADG